MYFSSFLFVGKVRVLSFYGNLFPFKGRTDIDNKEDYAERHADPHLEIVDAGNFTKRMIHDAPAIRT